ncbi:MAG TPA: hypothetical protein DD640_01650 [Clostridiales bacterium]|nr:hypothetical protein [Clostridiales bacterium]
MAECFPYHEHQRLIDVRGHRISATRNHLAAKVKISRAQSVHLPCNSGIKLEKTGQIPVSMIGPMSVPLVLFECDGDIISLRIVNHDPYANNKVTDLSFLDNAIEIDLSLGNLKTDLYFSSQASIEEAVAAFKNGGEPGIGKYRKPDIERIFILDLWLPEGEIYHNYLDLTELVKLLAKNRLAEKSLVYIPGWNAPYDTGYPFYKAAEALGGRERLADAVNRAASCGISVMPHLNFWGYDTATNGIADYEAIQMKNKKGEPVGWNGDTNKLAYIDPGNSAWQEMMFENIASILKDYHFKALYLDQGGCFDFNLPDSLIEGSVNYFRKLAGDFDDLDVIGIEMLTDKLSGLYNLCQLWGMPWCGLDFDYVQAPVSPVCKLFFGQDIAFMGHLGTPGSLPGKYVWTSNPFITSNGTGKAFQKAWDYHKQMGAIPSLRVDMRYMERIDLHELFRK